MSVSNILGIGMGFILPSFFVSEEIQTYEIGQKQIGDLMFYANLIVVVIGFCTITLMRNKPICAPSLAAESIKVSFYLSFGVIRKNGNFLILCVYFSLVIGNFNTLATLIAQMILPFGLSNQDSSVCGGMLILFGILGAGVYGYILDKTQNYKQLLVISNLLFLFSFVILVIGLYFDKYVVYFSIALMGFNVFPVIPLSFELACELTFPQLGEAFTTGLLMTGSQIVGIIQVLAFNSLLSNNQKYTSIIVIAIINIFTITALIFILFVKQKLKRSAKEIQNQ